MSQTASLNPYLTFEDYLAYDDGTDRRDEKLQSVLVPEFGLTTAEIFA